MSLYKSSSSSKCYMGLAFIQCEQYIRGGYCARRWGQTPLRLLFIRQVISDHPDWDDEEVVEEVLSMEEYWAVKRNFLKEQVFPRRR